MNKLTLLSRCTLIKNTNHCGSLYLARTLADKANKKGPGSSSSSNSDSSSSESDLNKKKSSNEAAKRLNTLLQDMLNEKRVETKPIELARPCRNKSREGNIENKVEPVEQKLVKSVKDVAESLGGDVKQTESELLAKLLSTTSKPSQMDLSEMVKGMKIDTEKPSSETSRADQVHGILGQLTKSDKRTQFRREPRKFTSSIDKEDIKKIDLFGNKPLGIFQSDEQYEDVPQLKTWQELYERELKLAVTHPPSNYFQQMILWTEQGKIWKFPIDNEQGIEEEKNIYFTEHVFLEKHLEPWCPPKGPIRHYMELVCVGLSKNPYMSVQHKKEHIAWYRDYFTDKQKLLKEIGALPQGFAMASKKEKKSKA